MPAVRTSVAALLGVPLLFGLAGGMDRVRRAAGVDNVGWL